MIKAIAFLSLIAVSTVSAAAQPESMLLISLGDRPTTGVDEIEALGIKVLVLDVSVPQKILDALIVDLPNTEEAAIAEVRARASQISAQEGANFLHPMVLIKQWSLSKLPALVFNNGESVIYGMTDFEQALSIWQEAYQ